MAHDKAKIIEEVAEVNIAKEFLTEEAKSSVEGGPVERHVLKISHGARPIVLI